jgi:hypothetical protein
MVKGKAEKVADPPAPFPAFVANLDILGFQRALSTLGAPKLAKMYAQALSLARHAQHAEIGTVVEYTSAEFDHDPDLWWGYRELGSRPAFKHIRKLSVFSDCIFIATDDQSDASLSEIVELSNCIFQFFLSQRLAIRGAICANEVLIWDEQEILIGQGVVDAYLLQESLQIVGVVAHENVGSNARLGELHTLRLKDNGNVNVRSPNAVQWPLPQVLQQADQLLKIFDELASEAKESGVRNVIHKYENGRSIVQHMLTRK